MLPAIPSGCSRFRFVRSRLLFATWVLLGLREGIIQVLGAGVNGPSLSSGHVNRSKRSLMTLLLSRTGLDHWDMAILVKNWVEILIKAYQKRGIDVDASASRARI